MKAFKDLITGTSYRLFIEYKDAQGTPIDITGASARLVLKKEPYGSAVADVTAIINGPNGTIEFIIPPENTEDLLDENLKETYHIAAAITFSDGSVVSLFQTTVEVVQNIIS